MCEHCLDVARTDGEWHYTERVRAGRRHPGDEIAPMVKKRHVWLLACVAVAVGAMLLLPLVATDPTTTDSGAPVGVTSSAASSASADPSPSPVQTAPVGDRVHISGCEFGDLKVPVVDLWESAERTRVVGEVAGDGPADQGLRCLGAVIIVRSVDSDQPSTMYEVETVVGNQRGWISGRFIGPTFDISQCGSFFSRSAAAAGKCVG